MSIKKIETELIDSAKVLISEGILTKDGCLSRQLGSTMLITGKGADLSKLTAEQISSVNLEDLSSNRQPANEFKIHAAIYNSRDDISALVHSTQQSVMTSSKAGKVVKPMLDDMAQIAGITVKTAECGSAPSSKELKAVVKKMKGRHAVFIKDQGILCGGSSLYDAHAVSMVMDKACKSFIETAFLGGGIKINTIESALMRFIYLKKYSKQVSTNN